RRRWRKPVERSYRVPRSEIRPRGQFFRKIRYGIKVSSGGGKRAFLVSYPILATFASPWGTCRPFSQIPFNGLIPYVKGKCIELVSRKRSRIPMADTPCLKRKNDDVISYRPRRHFPWRFPFKKTKTLPLNKEPTRHQIGFRYRPWNRNSA